MNKMFFSCFLLVVYLLVGCSPTTPSQQESSSLAATSVSEAESVDYTKMPEYATAQSWQRTYFAVVESALMSKEGDKLVTMGIYRGEGDPLMFLKFENATNPNKENAYYELWCIENGQAKKQYELAFDEELQLDDQSGLPLIGTETWSPRYQRVVSNGLEDAPFTMLVYKIVDGQEVPLYEFYGYPREASPNEQVYYSYKNNRYYTNKENYAGVIVLDENMLSSTEAIEVNRAAELCDEQLWSAKAIERMADYFFTLYKPDVPEQAPAWVSYYVRIHRISWAFPYYTNESVVNLGLQNRSQNVDIRITLHDPIFGDDVPVMEEASTGGLKWHYQVSGQPRCIKWEPVIYYFFYSDSNGMPLIDCNIDGGWGEYYGVSPQGLEFLFKTASSAMTSGNTDYAGAFYYTHEDGEHNEKTYGELLNAALTSFGYTLPLEPWPSFSFPLPKSGSWVDYEALLVQHLCDYARSIGQWGVGEQ